MRALLLAALPAAAAPASPGAVSFSYGGGTMDISLVGEGDAARVTFVPTGANASFLRYQGYINQTALSTAQSFTVTKAADHTILSRSGWSLNVSHVKPLVALRPLALRRGRCGTSRSAATSTRPPP